MSSEDAIFQVYYSGKFETSESNVITYVGGEVHTLESKPEAMLTNMMEALNMSLNGQRMWYKMPYEDFTELKMLCNGTRNFQKMCRAMLWTKAADVFLEKDDTNEENNAGIQDNRTVAADNRDVIDHEVLCGEDDVLSEDALVEENLAGFVDEEESYNDEATPPNSDCEEASRKSCYVKEKKGSDSIVLGQLFDTIPEFKDEVLQYSLKEKCNVRFTKWGDIKSEAKCTIGGKCQWRIYCSYSRDVGKYVVKSFNDHHSCTKDGFNKLVKDKIIAKMFLNDIRKDPTVKPKSIQDAIEEKYEVVVTNDQCRKAKKKALLMVQGEYDEQFARIKDYRLELIRSNPGSTVEVETLTNDDGEEIFDSFYVCFDALKKTWVAYCRPIIGIDGCFLKNDVKGQLLAAVGRDANNQFFPGAWAVVKKETTETWLWFFKLLKKDLNLQDGEGFTFISDRHKGLIAAVKQELPKVEHRMCARHIYGNLRRVYSGKALPKDLFWAVAKAFNEGDNKKVTDALKAFNNDAYDALMDKNPENCSRAFFTCTAVCEDVSNNFSESFNNAINKAREMPLIQMLETIRRSTMLRMDLRRKKALKHLGTYSLKVAKTITSEQKYMKNCIVHPSGNGKYEVGENGPGVTVNMIEGTCDCRRWSMTGIPCRHALRVILYKKLKAEDFVSRWYLTSYWRKQYSELIRPVNKINFWRTTVEPRIKLPTREVSQGPKKKQKRMKSLNESPKKKKSKGKGVEEPPEKKVKLPRKLGPVHCSACRLTGHNIRRCPSKPSKNSVNSNAGEGSTTQPSQNSCVE